MMGVIEEFEYINREKGRLEGRQEGRRLAVLEFAANGTISLAAGAAALNMSEEEFIKALANTSEPNKDSDES